MEIPLFLIILTFRFRIELKKTWLVCRRDGITARSGHRYQWRRRNLSRPSSFPKSTQFCHLPLRVKDGESENWRLGNIFEFRWTRFFAISERFKGGAYQWLSQSQYRSQTRKKRRWRTPKTKTEAVEGFACDRISALVAGPFFWGFRNGGFAFFVPAEGLGFAEGSVVLVESARKCLYSWISFDWGPSKSNWLNLDRFC